MASIMKESPNEVEELAAIRAMEPEKGGITGKEFEHAALLMKSAPKERRSALVKGIRESAKKVRESERKTALLAKAEREDQRRFAEGDIRKQWQKAIGVDERMLNRYVKVAAEVEQVGITLLNLFHSPEMREQAIATLKRTRNQINDTLHAVGENQGRWKAEFKEKWPELPGEVH